MLQNSRIEIKVPPTKRLMNLIGAAGLLALLNMVTSLGAAVLYVDLNSINPTPPYMDWSTAATTIQDAVDAASPGDDILVTNGIYATGGRLMGTQWLSNRVAVTKPLTLRSVNGPDLTIIHGMGTMRCVYLTIGAVLSGFTLTNGAASGGGGVWCESSTAVVTNCTVTGCWAEVGAGAYRGSLYNCTITGNSARYGGGCDGSTLFNCTLTGNSATYGGGVAGHWEAPCTLNNCTLTGNSAYYGGGAYDGTLNNCIVYYNTARFDGDDYSGGALNYCCTTPLPSSGWGNITNEPVLASASHLSAASPCRGAGSTAYASSTDIDGEPWADPPSIGCDEYHSGSVTGALSVAIVVPWTNVASGFALSFQGLLSGHASGSRWEFGDGTVVSNRPYATHAWSAPGDYVVVLRAFNESLPEGVSAMVTVQVVPQPVHYVAASSGNPSPPYATWDTAATSIQAAVDVAPPGSLILVSNGVYATGGRAEYGTMTNRVAISRPVTVQSVNGSAATFIQGYQVPGAINGDGAVRCVYLTSGAVLSGFTLTNGATRTAGNWPEQSGGGVWCESSSALVTNCNIAGNMAVYGGGVCGGTLNSCALTGNSAIPVAQYYPCPYPYPYPGYSLYYDGGLGGGVYGASLANCTLTANLASSGGGAYGGALTNSTLTDNRVYGLAIHDCMPISGIPHYGGEGGGVCGATLSGCILSNNLASPSGTGGGASGCTLIASKLTGNFADESGGGAASGSLNNCSLSSNAAPYGGGASEANLYNCTLSANSATDSGGGAFHGTLNNCILYYNTAALSGSNYSGSVLNYCCTMPLPTNGLGNIVNPPVFVDYFAGDLRLQSNSPCINAGLNTYAAGNTDLDGRLRILGGTVDMGAYEFQGPGMSEFISWLQSYGLPTDGSADYADSDNDRLNNWQEWRCLTDPTNALSALRLLSVAPAGSNVAITWQSVPGVNYILESGTDLSPVPSFTTIATNLAGEPVSTMYLHTDAAPGPHRFYRVGVRH